MSDEPEMVAGLSTASCVAGTVVVRVEPVTTPERLVLASLAVARREQVRIPVTEGSDLLIS